MHCIFLSSRTHDEEHDDDDSKPYKNLLCAIMDVAIQEDRKFRSRQWRFTCTLLARDCVDNNVVRGHMLGLSRLLRYEGISYFYSLHITTTSQRRISDVSISRPKQTLN